MKKYLKLSDDQNALVNEITGKATSDFSEIVDLGISDANLRWRYLELENAHFSCFRQNTFEGINRAIENLSEKGREFSFFKENIIEKKDKIEKILPDNS